MPSSYPPLNLQVRTPRLLLAGATDELLDLLVPIIEAGVVDEAAPPFDDPMSLYDESPQREWRWRRAIWAGRGRVDEDVWRLYFVVMVDGRPVGMQDVIGLRFAALGTFTTFSWLAPEERGVGLGKEMRAAALHLAFAGLDAKEASSQAFLDNHASNAVSAALGYQPNGTSWDTRRGDPVRGQAWRLTRELWEPTRRRDIDLHGVEACRPVLGL